MFANLVKDVLTMLKISCHYYYCFVVGPWAVASLLLRVELAKIKKTLGLKGKN